MPGSTPSIDAGHSGMNTNSGVGGYSQGSTKFDTLREDITEALGLADIVCLQEVGPWHGGNDRLGDEIRRVFCSSSNDVCIKSSASFAVLWHAERCRVEEDWRSYGQLRAGWHLAQCWQGAPLAEARGRR